MKSAKMTRFAGITASLAAAIGALGAAPASAAGLLQQRIDAQLASHPGGVQTGPGEISYQGGSVKLTIPSDAAPLPCASGWYCFYQYKNFEGRRLSFRDCGGTQFLTDYGFGNQTSSWRNTTTHLVIVYDQDTNPYERLWREPAYGASSDVGAAADNRAEFFDTTC